MIRPDLIEALDRLVGYRVRVTIEGVAKLGQLKGGHREHAYWIDDQFLVPLSAVTRIEQRHRDDSRPRPYYSLAWDASW